MKTDEVRVSKRFLIYGANGYTGKLIARMAKKRGMQPVLAARDAAKLKAVAEPLGLPCRAFPLDDPARMDEALSDIALVLNTAGPFSTTAKPMLDACLRAGAHYLDITGEIGTFESLAMRDREAERSGVMVMPGVGFDVVPSDCLLAHVAHALPSATKLSLGIAGMKGGSRGTAKSMVENINQGTLVRRDGKIVRVAGLLRRRIDFGDGPRPCVAVGWGDVSTAHHSTGIPNIEVYFEEVGAIRIGTALGRHLGWLLAAPPIQRFLKRQIDRQPEGPSDQQRAAGRSVLVAIAEDPSGKRVEARLTAPESYELTHRTALAIVDRVLQGEFKAGFQTPSRVYGPDFVLTIDGVTRTDRAERVRP